MQNKFSVSIIFQYFKHFVENHFQTIIKYLYFDNGEEFIALKPFLLQNGINHYTTTSHTTQQNGIAEWRQRHLVETGLTLLHDASLNLSYWSHTFQTMSYLINRQPTLILQNKSPFKVLFG